MWIMLSDAFLSIVDKDCARNELLVRARRRGDIQKLFPRAEVIRPPAGDYLYRAAVLRVEIAQALETEVRRISYSNFKDSVEDKPLHDAYLRCWTAMASVQETLPYGGITITPVSGSFRPGDTVTYGKSKKKRQRRKKGSK